MAMEKKQKMKPRIILVSVLMFFLELSANSQYFEDEIIYSNKFISKMQGFTSEQLASLIGSMQEYFIKGGNYKSVTNGQSVSVQLYDYVSNRIYNKTPKSDTLY